MDEMTTTAQSIVVASMAAGTLTSITSSSSQGIWSSSNQCQMLMLLPLVGAHLPDDVLFFLQELDFTLFSFSFIPSIKLDGSYTLPQMLEMDQKIEYLEDIGLESRLTIVNSFKLF
jgi:hypothetical protein